MATPDELRDEITKAQDEFRSALDSAAEKWDQKSGGSEPDWSPRQVAEHAVENELWYASEVCKACGYPGLDMTEFTFATLDDAKAGFDEAAAKSRGRLQYISDADLEMKHWRMGSVAGTMRSHANHLREHAAQMRTV